MGANQGILLNSTMLYYLQFSWFGIPICNFGLYQPNTQYIALAGKKLAS